MTPQARHADHLASLVPLEGRSAVDVGCGNGAFVLELVARGARATGIEIDEAPVARAREAVGARADIRLGRAEALPLDTGSAHLVCFIFSFHHVPGRVQRQALAEAARVLRPGGHLHVVDPRPYGAMIEVVMPIDDEREVRTRSQALLAEMPDPRFALVKQVEYELERTWRDAAQVIEMLIQVDPERAARAADPAVRAEVTQRFARNSRPTPAGYAVTQPCAAFTFIRT